MIKISCAIFISAFFLLRPFTMQSTGLWYSGDDQNYFARASALSFGQFPSYKKEYYPGFNGGMQSIGPGIFAAPFVFVFSYLDRAEGSDISKERSEKNIVGSWSQFGFVFSSVFYFCLACALLYRVLSSIVGSSAAVWAVILMVICQGMPLYAFRRPIFSHMAEFALQSIFICVFLKNEMTSGGYIKQWWSYALLGIGASLIFLTRYNNILFAVAWPLFFIIRDMGRGKIGLMIKRLFYVFIPFILVVAIFELWPEIYNQRTPYGYGTAISFLAVDAAWQNILNRIVYVFNGPDWGLFYTAPFLLIGIISLVFLKVPWKRRLVFVSMPLLVNFYIIIVSGFQGDWYGYRYFIASAFPLFVFPLAFLLDRMDKHGWGAWKWGLMLLALLPVMSMWCFEEYNTNLSLLPSFFGRVVWGNPTYQLIVWKTLIAQKGWFFALYQGGVQYFCYLFYKTLMFLNIPMSHSLNYDDFFFQTQILALTLPFKLKILIRVLLIYSLPFLTGWFFSKNAVAHIKNRPA
ncbi:MAG: hypothetical protein HQL12_02885 [Candidatus Omnitrophica bacterium]|nr:hypothetical protein [Candidatus Omnitrophota bacterium]